MSDGGTRGGDEGADKQGVDDDGSAHDYTKWKGCECTC